MYYNMGSALSFRESREARAEQFGLTEGPPEFHYDPPSYVELDPPPSYSEHMHNNDSVQEIQPLRVSPRKKRFVCFCFNGMLR